MTTAAGFKNGIRASWWVFLIYFLLIRLSCKNCNDNLGKNKNKASNRIYNET